MCEDVFVCVFVCAVACSHTHVHERVRVGFDVRFVMLDRMSTFLLGCVVHVFVV